MLTLDEKLKKIENVAELSIRADHVPLLLAALRRCMEQRDELADGFVRSTVEAIERAKDKYDNELLALLEGK